MDQENELLLPKEKEKGRGGEREGRKESSLV